MKRRSVLAVVTIAAAVLGGLYACSSDETTTSTPKVDGGGTDTGTKPDTGGGNTDSGNPADSGNEAAARTGHVTIAPVGDASTTQGSGTFVQNGNTITLTLNVTGSIPGTRGVHVHVGGDCANPGGHFNPDPNTRNGEFDNMTVNDAGVGTLTSSRLGISLDQLADGGTGIVGRSLNVHGIPLTSVDGGPLLNDAGVAVPPPRIGCGVITTP